LSTSNDLRKYLPYMPPLILIVIATLSYVADFWIDYWRGITFLGEEVFYVALLPIIYHGVSRALGIELIIIFSSSIWLASTLKNIFKMPRPPKQLWLTKASGYGFPSGHALGSSVFWGYLSIYYKVLIPTAITLIVLISVSRLILRVHYPVDVIGGLFIGFLVITGSLTIKRAYVSRMGVKAKVVTTIIYALILLGLSYLAKTLTYVEYMTVGVMVGSYLGHALLHMGKEKPPKLTIKGRVIGSIIALVISFVGYKLSMYIPQDPLLLPHYLITSLLMIYVTGVLVERIKLFRD